ncbi:DUF6790 family protein [Chachezhania sediminis]|uniref:DUF6790 family protein n=1 Tax=Chachezhania sediminis TaxID=2599291 RepID=UPI00131EAE3A|nr:DUF6790 family protein [Chachezhania sediminis]
MTILAFIPVILYLLAIVLGLLGVPMPLAADTLSPLTAWMLAVSLGLSSLWSAFGHLTASEMVAKSIGWATSPFQLEIGWANLGIGLGAIAAAVLGRDAAIAITIMACCFLWGAAKVHTDEMIREKNFSINNAGPIYFWDILTPLTLIVSLLLG